MTPMWGVEEFGHTYDRVLLSLRLVVRALDMRLQDECHDHGHSDSRHHDGVGGSPIQGTCHIDMLEQKDYHNDDGANHNIVRT
jgi:hypothetical protein